jgi:methionine-R-sulfoxide reductase
MKTLIILCAIALSIAFSRNNMTYNNLTEQERIIIEQKGTERAFTGKYYDHKANGTYICRKCNSPLFDSYTKFDSGSGWPSFDDTIKGAVREIPDADGRRIEIVCATCGGHLGHVFKGERMTEKNTRHCVNSLSLDFKSEK